MNPEPKMNREARARRRAAILADMTGDWTVPDLAAKYGMSRYTIERIARRAGVDKAGHGRGPRRLSPRPLSKRQQAMVQLREEGESLQQIGNRFGVSKERVRQIYEKHKRLESV
jgi:transposase